MKGTISCGENACGTVKVALRRLKPLCGGKSVFDAVKEAALRGKQLQVAGKVCAVNRPPLNGIANANRFIDFFHLERATGCGGITQIENGLIVGERLLAAAIYGSRID